MIIGTRPNDDRLKRPPCSLHASNKNTTNMTDSLGLVMDIVPPIIPMDTLIVFLTRVTRE